MRRHLPLLLLLLLAAGIQSYRLADKPLDFDERYSLNIATGSGAPEGRPAVFGIFPAAPLPRNPFTPTTYWQRFSVRNTIASAVADNGQAMPYFLTLHGWIGAFGLSVASSRLVSALFLWLAAASLYTVVLRNGGRRRVALLAAALLLFNGHAFNMAQYIRFYTLGLWLTVLTTGLTLQLQSGTAKRRTAWILGALWGLGMLTQYFFGIIVVAQVLFLLRNLRGDRRWMLPAGCVALAVGLFWLGPLHGWQSLVNVLHVQDNIAKGGWKAAAAPVGLRSLLAGFGGNLATASGFATAPTPDGKSWANIALALPAAALALRVLFRQPTPALRTWGRLTLWVLALYAAAALAHSLLTGFTLLFSVRYWTFFLPFGAVLVATGLDRGFRQGGSVRVLALAAGTLLVLRSGYTVFTALSGLGISKQGLYRPWAPTTQDYEGFAATLAATAGPGDTVAYRSWKTAQCTNWFLRDHPALLQTVDTTLPAEAGIRGSAGFRPVPVPIGRPRAARPYWD